MYESPAPYYEANNHQYTVKIRRMNGFDAARIKHGLLAMEYNLEVLQQGKDLCFFSKNDSTRVLTVHTHETGVDLLLPAFACTEDWELLRDWLLNFQTFFTAVLIAENDIIEDVEYFFNEAQINRQQQYSTDLLTAHMKNETPFHFYSIYRNFYCGKKIYERLQNLPADSRLTDFHALIRKSQYTSIHAAESLTGKLHGDFASTYSLLNNREDVILQPADMIQIDPGTGDPFYISYNTIDKLIRHGWQYLDEKQILIPRMNEPEWAEFCTEAKNFSINTSLFAKYIAGSEEDEEV